jgi:hypothetical protein
MTMPKRQTADAKLHPPSLALPHSTPANSFVAGPHQQQICGRPPTEWETLATNEASHLNIAQENLTFNSKYAVTSVKSKKDHVAVDSLSKQLARYLACKNMIYTYH